jgi:predicted nucleic acid-binding protein
MKKDIIATMPKFSPLAIAAAVDTVMLPPSLSGVDSWAGSKDIGGNVASYHAAINKKGQSIAICQLFGAYSFGACSKAEALQGIKNKLIREAFAKALDEHNQGVKTLQASTMLAFLRSFIQASMQLATVPAETKEKALDVAVPSKANVSDSEKEELTTDQNQANFTNQGLVIDNLRADNAALCSDNASLQAELARLRSLINDAHAARNINAAREILLAA